ncbi:hypothetical protein NE237_000547 [Protea cynaroides]|uniref:Uncharacterized protein n=1 Tax=Protea cynaroides TaxID=273540 RepID=A0A9Q0KSH4_9MAGN|nr:hypothetical protein NE237_000547 [Protea cynaroides]
MALSVNVSVIEDIELDDAALWTVIDAAVAASYSFISCKPLALKHSNLQLHNPVLNNPSPTTKFSRKSPNHYLLKEDVRVSVDGELLIIDNIKRSPAVLYFQLFYFLGYAQSLLICQWLLNTWSGGPCII